MVIKYHELNCHFFSFKYSTNKQELVEKTMKNTLFFNTLDFKKDL